MSFIYFALFLGITNIVETKEEISNLLFKITLAGFLVSLLGIFQKLTWADKLYWMVPIKSEVFFGPFRNENDFAFYISIVALVTLGTILANVFSGRSIIWSQPIKRIFLDILNKTFNKRALFAIFSFAIMVTALFLSKSRAGISFFIASFLLFALLILSKGISFREREKILWLILSGIAVTWALLSWIGIDRTLEELKTISCSSGYVSRVGLYDDAKNIFKDYPIFGIGIGAFSNLLPVYRLGLESVFYHHLYNEIFQLLIEFGIAGFIIVSAAFIIFLFQLFSAVERTKSIYKYYISMGILASFFYIGLHSTVHFGMRINAISSLLIILLSIALLVMHLYPSKDVLAVKMKMQKLVTVKDKKIKRVLHILFILSFIYIAYIVSKPFVAYTIIKFSNDSYYLKKVMRLDPENPRLYYSYYQAMLDRYKKGSEDDMSAYREAKNAIEKAMELNPYEIDYVIARGWLDLWQKKYDEASFFLKEAFLTQPHNYRMRLIYAYALFQSGLDEKDERKKYILLRKGEIHYRIAKSFPYPVFLRDTINDESIYKKIKEDLKKEGIFVE